MIHKKHLNSSTLIILQIFPLFFFIDMDPAQLQQMMELLKGMNPGQGGPGGFDMSALMGGAGGHVHDENCSHDHDHDHNHDHAVEDDVE